MPFLFQRPERRAISRATLRQFLNHALAVSRLNDVSNRPLVLPLTDSWRHFATGALRSGLPPPGSLGMQTSEPPSGRNLLRGRRVPPSALHRPLAPFAHEHSCVRWPQLRPDPAQEPRLTEVRDSIQARIAETRREGWLAEIAGLETTFEAAKQELHAMQRIASHHGVTDLGMPDFRDSMGRASALN